MAATPQSSDERLIKIANTLMLVRAAMAGNTQSSILVDLSDDDTAFFEESLSSGEYLDFLDRNPQFSALDAADAPDLTWNEYAAAGQSVEDFVNSFRRAGLAAEGSSTAVPPLHGSDEAASTTKADSQPAKSYQRSGNHSLSAVIQSVHKSTIDEVRFRAAESDTFKGFSEEITHWHAEHKPTPRIHTLADAFADAFEKAQLFVARSNPRRGSLISQVDLSQAQLTTTFSEVFADLANHAGIPQEHLYVAALSWVNELQSGQMTWHAGSVEYLQNQSVLVEPQAAEISQSESKTDESRH